MPTANQLVRKGRKRPKKRARTRHLRGAPQRRGTVVRSYVVDPRKPNSANRKVARVRFPDGVEVTAFFPGEGWHVREHDSVLVVGGSRPDLTGVRYQIVRGAADVPGVPDRRQGRSRVGSKRK